MAATLRILLPLLFACALARGAAAQSLDDLLVGHWIEVRGRLVDGRFVGERAEILEADDDEVLIGTIDPDSVRADGFLLLGQPVSISERTRWNDVDPADLAGRRVKVEGQYFGPAKFSGREISARGPGRERIEGRVDAIERVPGGVELAVMSLRVFLSSDAEIRCEGDPRTIALAPAIDITAPLREPGTLNEDDLFGEGLRISDTLRFSGQLEWRTTYEENLDLDRPQREDRLDDEASLRGRLTWSPHARIFAQAEVRYRYRWREDEKDGYERDGDGRLGETFVLVRDVLGAGWDLALGRQDFDDEREWVYDEDLDALRLFGVRSRWRLELGLSTTLTEGSHRDRRATNLNAWLQRDMGDWDLGLWALRRDFDLDTDEDALWVGARALGEILPQNESWLDTALLRGSRGDTDVAGWAYDVGTTWTPGIADERLSFTAGYAFASGDDDPSGAHDSTFRQTGFQDNNGRFAGVTSFRYYGELLDPELTNLGVLTLGLGLELAERTSLDLVFHRYTQDRLRAELLETDLDATPNGLDGDLGFELDAIFGCRRLASWDVELVGAWFRPGDAFDDQDDAFLAKLQLRYRF